MARHCVTYGHALSTARALAGAARTGTEVPAMFLGSWRSSWRFYGERIAQGVADRAEGITLIPKNECQARKCRRN